MSTRFATPEVPRELSLADSESRSAFGGSRSFIAKSALKRKNEQAVNPLVHAGTAILAFAAGFINVCGASMFAKTIGNVTGLVTKLGSDAADGTPEGFLVAQFCSFLAGSLVCGVLISSRRAGVGTELYGLVLMLVSALILAGWAKVDDDGVAPCLLAGAMGLQNGMLTKHAHAVVRTTHMTGLSTDLGVLLGHQLSRQLHRLMLLLRGDTDTDDKLAATRKIAADEWKQFKLLSLLFLAFFTGGIGGRAMFKSHGVDALLLPACVEAVMGFGYGLYRRWLRPQWKRRASARAPPGSKAALEVQTGEDQDQDDSTVDGSPERVGAKQLEIDMGQLEIDVEPDAYPVSRGRDPRRSDDKLERRPLSPMTARCKVQVSPDSKPSPSPLGGRPRCSSM